MDNKTVTHPVKLWGVKMWSISPLSEKMKKELLKRGKKDLLSRGRVVLKTRYDEKWDISQKLYIGVYIFECIYIGRRSILQKGVRHNIRGGINWNGRIRYYPRNS